MNVAVAQVYTEPRSVRRLDLRLFVNTIRNSAWTNSPRSLPTSKFLRYANSMLDEKDFQRKADAAFDDLKRRLLTLGDEHGFDVEGESGKLEVIFEEPEEAKFVVSPNTPVREIWISALSTSFKLGWSDSKNAFISEKTGENLLEVMSRVVSQQLGQQVHL
jgi:iron donor protein CyaY